MTRKRKRKRNPQATGFAIVAGVALLAIGGVAIAATRKPKPPKKKKNGKKNGKDEPDLPDVPDDPEKPSVDPPKADSEFDPFANAAAAQQALVDLGFDLGNFGPNGDGVDGDWGSASKNGLRDFITVINHPDAMSQFVQYGVRVQEVQDLVPQPVQGDPSPENMLLLSYALELQDANGWLSAPAIDKILDPPQPTPETGDDPDDVWEDAFTMEMAEGDDVLKVSWKVWKPNASTFWQYDADVSWENSTEGSGSTHLSGNELNPRDASQQMIQEIYMWFQASGYPAATGPAIADLVCATGVCD